MEEVCVRRGCGKKFFQARNADNICQFHPGAPVFHEGRKGWSCCKRRVDDFDEFMKIPGCSSGKHSANKDDAPPAEPVRSEAQEMKKKAAPSSESFETTSLVTSLPSLPSNPSKSQAPVVEKPAQGVRG